MLESKFLESIAKYLGIIDVCDLKIWNDLTKGSIIKSKNKGT